MEAYDVRILKVARGPNAHLFLPFDDERYLEKWVSVTWRLAAEIEGCRWVTCDPDGRVMFSKGDKPIYRDGPFDLRREWTGIWIRTVNLVIPEYMNPKNPETAIYEIRWI